MTVIEIALVGFGSAVGGIGRFLLNHAISGIWGTLLINGLGSGMLGYFMAQSLASPLKLLLMVGFCGGFTTFSTFSGQVVVLLQERNSTMAMGYILASIAICIGAAALGFYGGRRFVIF